MTSQAGLVAAGAADLVLARLRPDLPIAREPMSEYVHGPYSWVQIAVFFQVGAASLGIAWIAGGRRRGGSVSERPFLVIWGIGMAVAGLIDVEDQVINTEQGAVHNLVVKVAFVALLLAACVERPESTGERPPVRLGLIALLVVMMGLTAALEATGGYGAAQRGLGAVALVWIITYAGRIGRIPERPPPPQPRLAGQPSHLDDPARSPH